MAAAGQRTLITISFSHYCEKARWALDRAGLAYEERAHLPALHRAAVRRAGGGWTAPVLVCDDRVLKESAEIVAYADTFAPAERRTTPDDPALAAQARMLAAHFDEDLGPHTRRWAYHSLLAERDFVTGFATVGVPAWQRRAFPYIFGPISFAVRRILDITAETVVASEQMIDAVFDEVADRLADGRRFLVGDQFTTADLTFASLAAPVLVPREYGVQMPEIAQLPEAAAAKVETLREHPAGAYALALFRDERN